MKTTATFISTALVASLLVGSAAQAATTTGNASASVAIPLTIVQTAPLKFGNLSPSATAGTVNHYGQTTGGVTSIGVNAQPALFTVTGLPSANFNIIVPSTTTLTNGAQSMTATLTAPLQFATDPTGVGAFNVTGVLAVAANQASGNYTGTYSITVNY